MAPDRDPDWITGALADAAATERAPAHLRERIDGMARRPARRPSRRASWRAFVPTAGLLTALALVLVLALPGGGAGGPTVAEAAELSTHGLWAGYPPRTAPAVYAPFARVRFPRELAGWKVVTERVDRLDGREVLTIYYERGTRGVAYTIAAAPVLRGQEPGFTSFRLKGSTVVSWQESRHSCLLTSAQVTRAALLALARS